jgi:hypothetical protein
MSSSARNASQSHGHGLLVVAFVALFSLLLSGIAAVATLTALMVNSKLSIQWHYAPFVEPRSEDVDRMLTL